MHDDAKQEKFFWCLIPKGWVGKCMDEWMGGFIDGWTSAPFGTDSSMHPMHPKILRPSRAVQIWQEYDKPWILQHVEIGKLAHCLGNCQRMEIYSTPRWLYLIPSKTFQCVLPVLAKASTRMAPFGQGQSFEHQCVNLYQTVSWAFEPTK